MPASGGVGRGVRVLRSAPWLPVLGSSALAALLLTVAVLAHETGVAPAVALLGLACCGGSAAYVLDEDSATVLDVTPTSLLRRFAWRLLLLAVPGAVAVSGIVMLDRLRPDAHWLLLLPFAAGTLALGTALAAAVRRGSGLSTPGDLAGVVTVATVLLLVAADPLRRWAPVVPLGDPDRAGRNLALWAGLVGAAAVVVARCVRDPGAPRGRLAPHAVGPSRADHRHGVVRREPGRRGPLPRADRPEAVRPRQRLG